MRLRIPVIAVGLSVFLSGTAFAGQWLQNQGGWSYQQDDGNIIKEGWFTDVDGKVYNFNGGIGRKGFYKENDKWYYFNQNSSELSAGFVVDSGKTYFINRGGVMQTGWFKVNNDWYYADTDGSVLKNMLKDINGDKYFFKENGAMAKNEWVQNNTYFATSKGVIASEQWIDADNYVGTSGKVTEKTDPGKKKVKLENKVYTVAEYKNMVTDAVYRYEDECAVITENISSFRDTYNEEHVYNYTGDDDNYYTNNELKTLDVDDRLNQAATLRALELASQQRASGARPDGSKWESVIYEYGASYERLYESVAFGQDNGQDAYDDMNTGSHQQYWRNKNMAHIGVGAACDSTGKMYWVVLYAE